VRNITLFFEELTRNFWTTGAILPSSKAVASELTRALSIKGRDPLRILEVGSGTGSVTRAIAQRLMPGDHLDVVEINAVFVNILLDAVAGEDLFRQARNQIHVIEADILNLPSSPDHRDYDVIICCLPFNNFDVDKVQNIFDVIYGLLKPTGCLSYFEYWGIRRVGSVFLGSENRRRLDALSRQNGEIRKRSSVSTRLVLANLPPALIHHMEKVRRF